MDNKRSCESITVNLVRAAEEAARCYSGKAKAPARCPERRRKSRSENIRELHINLELEGDSRTCESSLRRSCASSKQRSSKMACRPCKPCPAQMDPCAAADPCASPKSYASSVRGPALSCRSDQVSSSPQPKGVQASSSYLFAALEPGQRASQERVIARSTPAVNSATNAASPSGYAAAPNRAMAGSSRVPNSASRVSANVGSYSSVASRRSANGPSRQPRHNAAPNMEADNQLSCQSLDIEYNDDYQDECSADDLKQFCRCLLGQDNERECTDDDYGDMPSNQEGFLVSISNNLCSEPKTTCIRPSRTSCRSRSSRCPVDNRGNDSRTSVRANCGSSAENLQERGAKRSRWEDSSNNSSGDEQITHNDDFKHQGKQTTYKKKKAPSVRSHASSHASSHAPDAQDSVISLNSFESVIPSSCTSAVFNWVVMIVACVIMLTFPLLIIRVSKPEE